LDRGLRTYCCAVLESQQQHVTIDLTGVTFVDTEGKALLRQQWQQGMQLRASGCLTRCVIEDITGTGRCDASQKD